MKGRAFIERLRALGEPLVATRDQQRLLADAVEIADEAARKTIECFAFHVDGVWWDIGGPRSKAAMDRIASALSYLDRRGLIERKPGEPHLVRFVEEA